jgi:predicted nucleotidyltransferase
MNDFEKLKNEIVKRLQPLQPEKIVLFGSLARDEAKEGSDIDLYIVTKDEYMPHTWREKMDIKLKFSRALRDIKRHYDIDLITHTKAMHRRFMQNELLFAKDIQREGKVIYGA